jgi:plasmid stability protein
MASLILRNIHVAIVKALRMQVPQHGVSPEAKHRNILEKALHEAETLKDFFRRSLMLDSRSRQ